MTTDTPVILYDTTLRDGTQGENITLSLADKIRIARMLDEYGMPFIEGGWPGSNPKDKEFFARARNLALSHARLTAFGATRFAKYRVDEDPSVAALVEAGTPAIAIFGKTWDLHVRRALGITLVVAAVMVAIILFILSDYDDTCFTADCYPR